MKARELHECDACGGPLSSTFYVVRLSLAVVNANAVREHLGLAQFFGGSHAMAEVFSPRPEVATVLAEAEGSGGWDEALVCATCWITAPLTLAEVHERVATRKAAAAGRRARASAPPKPEEETPA